MKIIVQMDPIERLNLSGDSTFALLLEAQRRGCEIDIYTPNMLTLSDGLLSAEAQKIKVYHSPDRIEKLNDPRFPFGHGYIVAASILGYTPSDYIS